MNAYEMLLLVAVVVVIAVDVYREFKNEMAWFLFPDCCDCSHHDRADSIGERMNAIDIMLIVCTVALIIVGVIINVWQWFLNHGYMHVVSRYSFLRVNKVDNVRESDFIYMVLAIVLITWALSIMWRGKQWKSYSTGWKY